MNLTIDASSLQRLAQRLSDSPWRGRNAVAAALTTTAWRVRDAEVREMRDVFDRPTPYTLRAIQVSAASGGQVSNTLVRDPATGAQMLATSAPFAGAVEARVSVRNDGAVGRGPLSWLRWQIRGGLRTPTAFEKLLVVAGAMESGDRAVPGRFARLDAYGNVSRGQIGQIMSQLRIETVAGYTRSLPRINPEDNLRTRRSKASRIRSAYKRAGGQFVAFPRGRGKLRPGLYQMRDTAWGRAQPRPVLVFVSKAEYEAERYDFFDVARRTVRSVLPQQLAGRMAVAMLRRDAAPGTRVSLG